MADDYDLNNPGGGLAGYMLNLYTLLMLEKRGVFSQTDLIEIVEHCLLNLEMLEAKVAPASQETSQAARALLERLRKRISPRVS
jgi:hypothetical protein